MRFTKLNGFLPFAFLVVIFDLFLITYSPRWKLEDAALNQQSLSRQQLDNHYWVALKGSICCDQVQLEFEPWIDKDSYDEIYFQIRFHK